MVRRTLLAATALGAFLTGTAGFTMEPAVAANLVANDCASLSSQAPAGVMIQRVETTSATWETPAVSGRTPGPVARAVCRVIGQIDGDVGFEVWLPLEGWNGRFLGTGVGGNAGYLNYPDMARGVEQGFAAASTDTGHAAADVTWPADPRRSANYAHLAQHRLAQASKAIVETYYGRPSDRNYFIGCSGGGRQAAKELQDYPSDYDGIIVGAPGFDLVTLSARHLMASLHAVRDPAAAIDASMWERIGSRAIAACDENDGLKDGIVTDPASCQFDVASLACEDGAGEACLTAPQLAAVKASMAPVRAGGRDLDEGLYAGITPRPGPPPGLAKAIFGLLVHDDPNWDPVAFDPERDIPAASARMPNMAADLTDISAFVGRGGKAIFYHGLQDPSTLPQQTIAYVDAALRDSGPESANALRLYLPPAMLHCSGGAGADRFGGAGDRDSAYEPGSNLLAALVAWVEEGRDPGVITAAHLEDGRTTFTRPLCPYPAVAAYKGRGDPSQATSFVCRVPDPS